VRRYEIVSVSYI